MTEKRIRRINITDNKENVKLAVGLVLVILIFIFHAIYLNCVAEDAFITFRFAKNLVAGEGLIWNKGEPPVEGYTNFLWVILSGLFLKLRLNVALSTQVTGVLASVGSILCTRQYASSVLGLKNLYSLIPGLFLAFSGPFATWSSSGMETNFFGFFALLGCYYFAQFWKRNSRKDIFLCYFALLIATLTRPEGLILFFVILSLNAFFLTGQNTRLLKGLLIPALLYVVPYFAYFFWRFSYYGYLLPNTFYAKTGGGLYQYLRGTVYSGYFTLYFILPLTILFVFARKQTLYTRIHPVSAKELRNHLRNHVGIYSPAFLCLTYFLYIIYVGGDYLAMYRFFVPILPFLYILFGLYVYKLFSSNAGFPAKRIVIGGFVALAAFATAYHSTPWEKQLFPKPHFQHGHFRGVERERWHSARLSFLGTFFNRYRLHYGEALATDAIGAISYYADMKIYDMYGLVDVHIAHQKGAKSPLGSGFPGHEKGDLSYILSKRPTYIMFNRKLTKKPLIVANPDGFPNYKHTSVWLVDKRNREAGFFTFLELKK